MAGILVGKHWRHVQVCFFVLSLKKRNLNFVLLCFKNSERGVSFYLGIYALLVLTNAICVFARAIGWAYVFV